jgi:excisionase family DNA binding protein
MSATTPFAPLLLKAKEAAQALAISERKLWELTNRGEIPKIVIGRAVRYFPEDLRTWAEAQRSHGGGA